MTQSRGVSGLIALLGRERRRVDKMFRARKEMTDEAKRLFELGKKDGFTADVLINIDVFKTAATRYGTEAADTQQLLGNLKATYEALAGVR